VKILGLSCSPRKNGNTVFLLNEALKGAQQEGADVELYSVSGKTIEPCDGCFTCAKTGECHIKDDMQEIYDKMVAADGIIFGTPIYMHCMAAQTKIIIDRTMGLGSSEKGLANKVGGVVAVCGSLGLSSALKDLYFFIVTRPMLPANFVAAYGGTELTEMKQCMQAALNLGRQMVALVKMNFKYPTEFMGGIRGMAYGTHTK
jgi:multimeric flavodoxin WrbA